jgi:cytochrome c biogenesis protein CcmG, thiol:disulfide interchange protein DsbE
MRISLKKIAGWVGLLLACLLACGCDRGAQPALVGRPAPDFTVRDSDRSVSLHDLRGKVIVLNFWASNCAPCIEELPSLIAMQSQMKDRVNVLAVSLDQDDDAYHRFLREHEINLLTVHDSELKSGVLYKTDGYPETFIIDTHGVIRRKFIGAVEWTKPEILQYLKQL